MIKAQNLIFEGEYYLPLDSKNLRQSFDMFKDILVNYLSSVGFFHSGQFGIFGSTNFFTWKFLPNWNRDIELPLKYKIFEIFGNNSKVEDYKFEKILASKRIEIPYSLEIYVKLEKNEGVKLIVRSTPVCYIRLGQGAIQDSIVDEQKYSFIVNENIQFIKDAMSSIHAYEIKTPRAKSSTVKFALSDRLRILNLKELADLSDRAYSRINDQHIEEGLSDLRVVVEKIFPELIKMTGHDAKDGKIKTCLEILQTNGYIDKRMFELVDKTLREFIYSYLSDLPTHNRERNRLISERDANYVFYLFEKTLSYLLDKVFRKG